MFENWLKKRCSDNAWEKKKHDTFTSKIHEIMDIVDDVAYQLCKGHKQIAIKITEAI